MKRTNYKARSYVVFSIFLPIICTIRSQKLWKKYRNMLVWFFQSADLSQSWMTYLPLRDCINRHILSNRH